MQEENNKKSDAALREEKILKFWRENKIFEKTLNQAKDGKEFIFYDGPPFATGTPHYGHILGSTVKDVIGRYQTMRGFRVPRRWGWDCHGLPIENIVENDLKISGKKEIEALGIDKFVEHARSKVLTYVLEWQKTIDRVGRWVDFDNSYKTMDNTFIESVWWALGELHKKDLLYEGVRVLAYCPRCETPIANSEIAMDNSYKDITDISVYVKFKLKNELHTYLLAWTTTPWTLPGNTAIAVNNKITYLYVSHTGKEGKEILILAKDRFDFLKEKFINPEIVKEVKGSELIGLSYEPVFDYYKNIDLPNKENIWKVWSADFVTLEVGTGIAHEAPAFGEEDMNLAQEHNIPFIRHVEPNGTFTKEVADFAGIKVKPKEDSQATDVLIIKYLAKEGKLFEKEKIIHSYPHCYRCETPLLYYALPSWFVNIQKAKNGLLENAKSINWIPAHLKKGRFKNTMENAPDWTISRNRYWASPLPIWKSESGKTMFVNSLEDLKRKTKKSGNKYFVMRHGVSESNLKGNVSCNVENIDHLTEDGKKQVLDSIEELKKQKINFIISSDFIRTKETGEIIKHELNIRDKDFIFDKRIREFNVGIFNGKTWNEYFNSREEKDWYSYISQGGESCRDVKFRMINFLYDVEKKYKNKNILIITHEGPTRMLIAGINGLNDRETIKYREKDITELKNAQITKIAFIPFSHNKNYELDLHRPYIDVITLVDEKGEEYKRIPEVIDCWFESGSMPFAQDHYPFDFAQGKPFENLDWKKKNFPADFVAEYIAQTRTWFYYTHVISSILFNKAPFKNVVTTGTILAEDGEKMSKSKNNFPDPSILFDKYGVDALRFYLISCPVMKGEDINFSEKAVQDISNKIINRLNNVVAFYELYRDRKTETNNQPNSNDILDRWIICRLEELISEITARMKKYELILAIQPLELFIEDLSVWYLRRSRERIKEEATKFAFQNDEARPTLYFVLKTLAKLMAPFTPFISENIWQKLKTANDQESVHLENWPAKKFKIFSFIKPKVLEKIETVRSIVTLGLEARQKVGIKVRQPLNRLEIVAEKLSYEYIEIIKDELNIKNIDYIIKVKIGLNKVNLDTNITPELKQEGDYRELARALQEMRKKMGLTPSNIIALSIDTSEAGKNLIQKFEADLKKTVLISGISFQDNDGAEIVVDDLVFKVKIAK